MNALKIGILFCLTAVLLGAFGAHALKTRVSAEDLAIFETGVRYQMFHGLGLLLLGIISNVYNVSLKWSFFSMTLGVVVFSGSLYILVLSGVRMWGAVTPIGGVALILAWGLALWGSCKKN